jgi:hypothetical protein
MGIAILFMGERFIHVYTETSSGFLWLALQSVSDGSGRAYFGLSNCDLSTGCVDVSYIIEIFVHQLVFVLRHGHGKQKHLLRLRGVTEFRE